MINPINAAVIEAYNSGNRAYAVGASLFAISVPVRSQSVKASPAYDFQILDERVLPTSATYYPSLEKFVGHNLDLRA